MEWIDRQEREPPTSKPILVWGESWPKGVIACVHEREKWVDAVDKSDVLFQYWMTAPERPGQIPDTVHGNLA